jgi:hypothetical protein
MCKTEITQTFNEWLQFITLKHNKNLVEYYEEIYKINQNKPIVDGDIVAHSYGNNLGYWAGKYKKLGNNTGELWSTPHSCYCVYEKNLIGLNKQN